MRHKRKCQAEFLINRSCKAVKCANPTPRSPCDPYPTTTFNWTILLCLEPVWETDVPKETATSLSLNFAASWPFPTGRLNLNQRPEPVFACDLSQHMYIWMVTDQERSSAPLECPARRETGSRNGLLLSIGVKLKHSEFNARKPHWHGDIAKLSDLCLS